jgi:hypothetical protein
MRDDRAPCEPIHLAEERRGDVRAQTLSTRGAGRDRVGARGGAAWSSYLPTGSGAQGQTAAPAGVAFADVSAGDFHTCGTRASDGQTVCWGTNYFDELSMIPDSVSMSALASGYSYTCGIRSADDTLTCWGRFPWNPR